METQKRRPASAKKFVNKKLQQAIEKTKKGPMKGPMRGPRDLKKKGAARPRKQVDLGDEEITSNDSSLEENKGEKDDFFIEDEEEEENADEKKTRLAKELLTKINNDIEEEQMQDQEEDEFLKNLKGQSSIDREEVLAQVLKRRATDVKGKLHHKIADRLDIPSCTSTFIKGHKKAITDFVFSKDEKKLYSVSKDCCILEWDLEDDSKIVFNKGKKHDRSLKNGGHFDEIMAVDLSRDQKLLATGGKDRILRIWNTSTRTLVAKFKGHVDTITSVKFDNENDNLYSVSADMTLKIWNMREM